MKNFVSQMIHTLTRDNNSWAYFILLFLSFFFMLSLYLTPLSSNDFWIQMKVGELIRSTGNIPNNILFTFTEAKSKPFVAHEWLPSLFFSYFLTYFGYYGMICLKFTLFFILFLLVLKLCYRVSRDRILSFLIASLCLYTVNYRSFFRPEIVAYLCFMLQLNNILLFLDTRNMKYFVFYLLVHLIWSNSHGSFLVSVGLPVLFLLGSLLDSYFIYDNKRNFFEDKKNILILFSLTILSFGVSIINPFGFQLLEHVYNLSQNQFLKRTIFEWFPTFSPQVKKTVIYDLFILFSCSFFCVFCFRFRKLNFSSVFLFVIFLYLAFQAQRHIAFYALAASYPLALMMRDLKKKKTFRCIAYFSCCFIFVGTSFYSSSYGNTMKLKPGFYKSARISDHALKFIKDKNITGNVLNSYSFGGQLLYHFYPRLEIFVDSRVDAYGEKYMAYYKKVFAGKYAFLRRFIKNYNINYIIINKKTMRRLKVSGNYKKLTLDGWKVIYSKKSVFILQLF